MPKLPEFITKKVGPLPIWSYVVIGGVLVFILRKRGGGSSSSSNPAGTINIPTLSPGTPTDSLGSGSGAVGSPAQNAMGGMDTQPGGAAPWWTDQPAWWAAGPGGGANPATSGGGGGNTGAQSNASAGVTPKQPIALPTAAALGSSPSGGWTMPPIFQRIGNVVRDMSGGGPAVGQVNPGNKLLGYSDPVTGALSPTPNGGPAIWA